jgi:hypothetical protein
MNGVDKSVYTDYIPPVSRTVSKCRLPISRKTQLPDVPGQCGLVASLIPWCETSGSCVLVLRPA